MKHTSHIFFFILCLAASISHAQLPSYLPTNGLVAWYPFNGNANDESGNGFNGTVFGATPAVDRNGNEASALQFQPANEYITFPTTNTIGLANFNGLTISFWYNAALSGNMRMVHFFDSSYDLSIHYSSYGELHCMNYTSNVGESFIHRLQAPSNQWTNIIWTLDFTNNISSIYFNGELVSQLFPQDILVSSSMTMRVSEPTWQFIGKMDDIGVWNRVLSSTEVEAVSNFSASGGGNSSGETGNTGNTVATPPGIPYQAEVRNDSGEVLANTNVNVRFTLHELTANGTVSYQETHAVTANELGLFAATIGGGTATQGTFAGINWSQTTKFLKVEVDAGNGYITMGNQQLMSVPYALYAANGPQGPAGLQGEPGMNGMNGNNGFNSLIRSSTSNLDSLCSNGVVIIESGLDINRNGVLENSEVNPSQSNQICFNAPTNAGFQGKRIGFSTSGNWTCPSGVYQITVELWGAGGACNSQVTGGTGGYTRSLISVVPETNYNIQIGLGGVGSTGISGGSSNFNGILEAPGGSGACNGCYYEPATNGAVTNWPYSNINSPNYIPSSWFNVPTLAPGGQINCFSCPNHVRGSDGFCIITY